MGAGLVIRRHDNTLMMWLEDKKGVNRWLRKLTDLPFMSARGEADIAGRLPTVQCFDISRM